MFFPSCWLSCTVGACRLLFILHWLLREMVGELREWWPVQMFQMNRPVPSIQVPFQHAVMCGNWRVGRSLVLLSSCWNMSSGLWWLCCGVCCRSCGCGDCGRGSWCSVGPGPRLQTIMVKERKLMNLVCWTGPVEEKGYSHGDPCGYAANEVGKKKMIKANVEFCNEETTGQIWWRCCARGDGCSTVSVLEKC